MNQYLNKTVTINTVSNIAQVPKSLTGVVTGILRYESAKLLEPNLEIMAVNMLPYVDIDNYTTYEYVLVKTDNGNFVIADEWISDNGIVVVNETITTYTLRGLDTASRERIQEFLYTNGFSFDVA